MNLSNQHNIALDWVESWYSESGLIITDRWYYTYRMGLILAKLRLL